MFRVVDISSSLFIFLLFTSGCATIFDCWACMDLRLSVVDERGKPVKGACAEILADVIQLKFYKDAVVKGKTDASGNVELFCPDRPYSERVIIFPILGIALSREIRPKFNSTYLVVVTHQDYLPYCFKVVLRQTDNSLVYRRIVLKHRK